jgi:hypothetical protein
MKTRGTARSATLTRSITLRHGTRATENYYLPGDLEAQIEAFVAD